MKKIVIVQIIFLACTTVFGLILKGDLESGLRIFHKTAGVLSGLGAVVLVVAAFVQKQTTIVKILSIVILLFTASAAMGGMSLESTLNYNFAFMQMAGSGVCAFILSLVLAYKLKAA